MGLKEQVQAGAKITRDVITVTDTVGSGSVALGGSFLILSIESTQPARLRIYDTIQSRDDSTEISRIFGSTVPPTVALVGDYSMSLSNTVYTINPASIGHTNSATTPLTYYRCTPSGSSFKINRLLIEDTSITPAINTSYTENNRRLIQITPSSTIAALAYASGTFTSITSPTVPKTYIMVSASLANSSHMVRFRMYNNKQNLFLPFLLDL